MRTIDVMVVDDDEDVAALLEALVEVNERFTVRAVVETVEEALTVAGGALDVVALDLDRAGHDGLEVLVALRAEVRCPIVVFASFPDPLTLLEVVRLGAEALVDKGRVWSDLLPTISTLCEEMLVLD